MADLIKTTGMVLSAMPVGEYDKRLVILTKERGKISAFVRGARRQNSPMLAGSRPFSFGEFMLYEGRSSYTVSSINISHYFMEISSDFYGAYYGFYFLEFADYYTRENVNESEMIKLLFQSIRALLTETIPNELIQYIYELKAMMINGEYPNVFSCVMCKSEENLNGFSVKRNGVVCSNCKNPIEDTITINESTVYTLQYIISVGIEKLYTFTVSKEVLKELSMVLNRLKSIYIDKKMKSLDILMQINSQKLD
ncbi:MAG: DNA repair protein RecO [Clostridiales bacterium]|nr:DNA repair protein RecO [Clostridiales bacterium]